MCLTLAKRRHHPPPHRPHRHRCPRVHVHDPSRRARHPRRLVAPATGPTAADRHRHPPPPRRHRADRPVRQHLDLPRHRRHPHRRPRPPAPAHPDRDERRHPMTTNAGCSTRPTPTIGHHARPPPPPPRRRRRRRELRRHPDHPAWSGRGNPLPLINSRPPQPSGLPPHRAGTCPRYHDDPPRSPPLRPCSPRPPMKPARVRRDLDTARVGRLPPTDVMTEGHTVPKP